jgi:hypothetical protein
LAAFTSFHTKYLPILSYISLGPS